MVNNSQEDLDEIINEINNNYNRNIINNRNIIDNIDNNIIQTPSPHIVPSISEALPNVQVQPLKEIPEDILSTIPKNVQEILEDKVSLEIMTDPVINSQGQTYNRSTMETIIEQARRHGKSPKDPITKQMIGSELIPNMVVRSLIQTYYPQAGGKKKKKASKKKKISDKKRKTKKRSNPKIAS